MNHGGFGGKLAKARELTGRGLSSGKVAAMLDVSPSWVRKHTRGLKGKQPAHRPRAFDHDKALAMLERGVSGYRVAKRMRVHKNTIYSMVKRRAK